MAGSLGDLESRQQCVVGTLGGRDPDWLAARGFLDVQFTELVRGAPESTLLSSSS